MKRCTIIAPATTYRLLCSTAAIILALSPIAFTPSIALAAGQGSGGESSGGGGGESSGGSGGSESAGGSGGANAGGSGGASVGGGGSTSTGGSGGTSTGGGMSTGGSTSTGGGGGGDVEAAAPGGGSGSGSGGSSGGGGSNNTGGTGKGDLYGDLFVILRDGDGIPILTEEGFVQPIDEAGNLIPLDEEGAPIDPEAVIEVELGRTNVGRAPEIVLETRTDEVLAILTDPIYVSITQDAAGRLLLTDSDGVEKTIDSPLDNLAIYTALLTTGSLPQTLPDGTAVELPGTDYDFLIDGQVTVEDMELSAALLAAATDKTSPFSSDEIAYLDAFLGINTVTVGDVTYSDMDYSTFSYDRSDTYGETYVEVLVYNETTGTWDETNLNIYADTDLFKDEEGAVVDVTVSGTLDAYTQAAEDARVVLEFIHNFAVPE